MRSQVLGKRKAAQRRLRDFLFLQDAAAYIGCSPSSLVKKSWRRKVGLAATRIGHRLAFKIGHLDSWLESRREDLLSSAVPENRPKNLER